MPARDAGARPTRGTGILEALLARLRIRRALAALIPPPRGDSILDIGCGSNPWFLLRAPFTRKIGLDPEAASPGTEDSGVERIRFAWEPGARLPFPDADFACVSSLAVIEHLDPASLPGLFAEMNRVLAPGGRLILTTPHAVADPVLRALARLGLVSREEIDEHKSLFRHQDLRALLQGAGFKQEGIRVAGFLFGWNIVALADK